MRYALYMEWYRLVVELVTVTCRWICFVFNVCYNCCFVGFGVLHIDVDLS